MNNDKSKVAKLGATRGRSIPRKGMYDFRWTSPFTFIGINCNIEKCLDDNSISDSNIELIKNR